MYELACVEKKTKPTYSKNGTYKHASMLITASIHHITQAMMAAQFPHAGTHMNTVRSTIVAKPMGNVPSSIECAGCVSICQNLSGQSVYRAIETVRKSTNRPALRVKMTTAM